jgi:uncharacterized SAM-dependent methyltransferase
MLYIRNSELVKKYHISEKTAINWIKEAKSGKLGLELYEENGKARIANTNKNIKLIEQLVEARKKYRNNRAIKTVSPKPEFYNLFTKAQILDLASNLDIRREIPFQYGYFDGGAEFWDKYAERLAAEEISNFLTVTVEQLRDSQEYFDRRIASYKQVNVIDIGPGNVMPVRDFLQHLVDQKKIGKYVAVDISPDMLKIAERNVHKWFGDTVPFESYEADINYDRFTELLSEYTIGESANDTINIVLVLGGTFANLRSPNGAFKIIHDSMNRNDLFIYNLKLDTEAARHYFDFDTARNVPALDLKSKLILDMLGIEDAFYDVEVGYDAERRERFMRLRLKVELKIKFVFEKGERILAFDKNETILVWRFWHQNVQDVVNQLYLNDFDILQSNLTEDKQYLLTISRVSSER